MWQRNTLLDFIARPEHRQHAGVGRDGSVAPSSPSSVAATAEFVHILVEFDEENETAIGIVLPSSLNVVDAMAVLCQTVVHNNARELFRVHIGWDAEKLLRTSRSCCGAVGQFLLLLIVCRNGTGINSKSIFVLFDLTLEASTALDEEGDSALCCNAG